MTALFQAAGLFAVQGAFNGASQRSSLQGMVPAVSRVSLLWRAVGGDRAGGGS